MNVSDMNLEQITARKNEIRSEMTAENADLAALTAEVGELNTRAAQLKSEQAANAEMAEKRAALTAMLGTGAVGSPVGKPVPEKRSYGADSPEYRTAWLKHVAVTREGVALFEPMTAEERTAFTHTTSNTADVVPTVILNRIIDLMDHMCPMLNDAAPSFMTQGFGVPRAKAINAGDADTTAEGQPNPDDEENDYDLLTLTGVEIKKHVNITRKMQWQSISAFEDWLVQELAQRIAVAKEKLILARLDGTAPTGGSAVANAGIDSGNILTGKTYDDATIRSLFAMLHGSGLKVVYANNKTIWEKLFGIVDSNGDKLFVQSSMVDPVVQGRIYGAQVKQDENLGDNVVYIGIPSLLLKNDFDPLFILPSIHPTSFVKTVAGYSLFDAGLYDPKAFVKVTFNP